LMMDAVVRHVEMKKNLSEQILQMSSNLIISIRVTLSNHKKSVSNTEVPLNTEAVATPVQLSGWLKSIYM